MIVATVIITLYAPWVHSLKEKRMVVKSMVAKIQNKFHVSCAEVDMQDIHQTIVIGIAGVAGSKQMADSMTDQILSFIEDSTEAQMVQIEREIR